MLKALAFPKIRCIKEKQKVVQPIPEVEPSPIITTPPTASQRWAFTRFLSLFRR